MSKAEQTGQFRQRTERIPFGVARQKGSLDPATLKRINAGWCPRWINDVHGGERIRAALLGGYRFVMAEGNERVGDGGNLEDKGHAIHRFAGSDANGRAYDAYLMQISSELYQKDQAAKEAINMRVDNAIRGGRPTAPTTSAPSLPSSSQGGVSVKQCDYNP